MSIQVWLVSNERLWSRLLYCTLRTIHLLASRELSKSWIRTSKIRSKHKPKWRARYFYVTSYCFIYFHAKRIVLSLSTIWNRIGGAEVQLHSISVLHASELLPSRPGSFNPAKEPLYLLIRGRIALRLYWSALRREKHLFPPTEIRIPDCPARTPSAFLAALSQTLLYSVWINLLNTT